MAGGWRIWTVGVAAAAIVALVLADGRGARCDNGAVAEAAPAAPAPAAKATVKGDVIVPVVKTEAEWKKLLPPQTFWVMRESGTEIAFTGRYWNTHARGTYVCASCDLPLFTSATKYDSGTGWPSFWQPIAATHLTTDMEIYRGQGYTEVKCARCGGHLGHVFDDGPAPTGMRYCMNSAALKFIPSR